MDRSMSELTFPKRMFKTGCELPEKEKKKVNVYFKLHWIETIKNALDVEQNQRLAESQFKKIMQMGKHTFSVRLLHHLLMLQLKTSRESELWWTFSGKPIRYAIEDFSLVTGLNCKPGNQTGLVPGNRKGKRKRVSEDENEGEIWSSLFSKAENPTPDLIAAKLENKECKDPLKVFRLALLLLVEGILFPTSGSEATRVRPEIVEMVGDVEKFMQHPWGRESFLLTVKCVKKKPLYDYVGKTSVALQGFAHAMLLVTACSCPAILGQSGKVSPEDTLQSVLGEKFTIDVSAANILDKRGQAKVQSLLVDQWEDSLRFEEKPDLAMDNMLASIADNYPFDLHTWSGGVTLEEALQGVTLEEALQKQDHQRDARDGESSVMLMIAESFDAVSDADEPVRKRQKTKKLSLKETFEKNLKELKDQIKEQNEEIMDKMRVQNEEITDKMRVQNEEITDKMRVQNEEITNLKAEIKNLKCEGMYNRSGRYRDMETGEASSMDPLEDAAVPLLLPPTELAVPPSPFTWPTITNEWVHRFMSSLEWSSWNLPPSQLPSLVPVSVIDSLTLVATDILRKEPNCVCIDNLGSETSVVVVGDLHGQLQDLLFLLKDAGFPCRNRCFVFNGNYVDRGAWGLETFLVLLSWKVLMPDRVFLLRGNHETQYCSTRYGFLKEVVAKYGDEGTHVYEKCLECFINLPLATIIAGTVYTAHGGLFRGRGPNLKLGSLKELDKADRRLLDPPGEGPNVITGDVIWSDPSMTRGLGPNEERCQGLLWGPDCTEKFLKNNKLKLIIRSHEGPDAREDREDLAGMLMGFSIDHDGASGKLITVFSTPDYPQFQAEEVRYNNKGAYVILQPPDLFSDPQFRSFEAVPRPEASPYR